MPDVENWLQLIDNFYRMTELEIFFAGVSESVDKTLELLLPGKGEVPERLHEAMHWSVFAGGKRFRPALVMAVGLTFGAPDNKLLRTAAAVEMLHTYSLIHDDLPAMDDDDLRRGRETCHKRFGEATAILAGDALQALAFQAISEDEHLSAAVRLDLIEELARAAAKMVSGQQLDLEAELKSSLPEDIRRIHEGKTGALVRFSALAGAIIAEATESQLHATSTFGGELGLLFQITDDLLDVTQTSEALGKTAGKDVLAEKATYPAVVGMEETKNLAETLQAQTIDALQKLDRPVELLQQISDFILNRQA